jgi:arsenate reductase
MISAVPCKSGLLRPHFLAMLLIYTYAKCSTCRDALKWLDRHDIPHEVRPIRESPPTRDELGAALKAMDGELRKLFNTAGQDYRELGMKDRLPTLTEEEAIHLLTQNGNLVKRPFAIGPGTALVGFKPEIWHKTLL